MNLMENVEKAACPLLKLKQAEKRVHITTHFDRQFFSDLCILRIDGKREKTSDAGSQYRCGRLGRGIKPPTTPQTPFHTQSYIKSIQNAHFSTFRLDHLYGRTDGPTNGRTDGRTKPLIELRVHN